MILKQITLCLLMMIYSISMFGTNLNQIPDLKQLASHPRLLMNKSEEKNLIKKLRQDKNWSLMHKEILNECEGIITKEPSERVFEGKRMLNVSRETLRRIFYLSYAYRTTVDKRYAERACKEMLYISEYPDWNPRHFLDVAEMTLAFALGYDWCFDALDEESKGKIKKAILDKGLKPSLESNNNYWTRADNNWNQVCNAGMTLGALAVYEEDPELAQILINRAIKTVPVAMNAYAPDGAYTEGIGYWYYGTSFSVLLADALKGIYKDDFGLGNLPGFIESAVYSQHVLTPSGDTFSYADVGTKTSFNSQVFWFYAQTKDPSLFYLQKKAFESDKRKKYLTDRLLPMAIIYGVNSGAQLSNPKEPKDLMWVGNGVSPVAFMRSSWSDPDAVFLGFKAGTPSSNHGHMDVGSFFIEAEGVKWALDLGMQRYNTAEQAGVDLWNKKQESGRWDVFRLNNFAHNTLTFNGKYQRVEGHASIQNIERNENHMSVSSDITNVYAPLLNKAVRRVALVNKKEVIVTDTLITGKNFSKVRWNMVTEADQIRKKNDKTIELEKNGKKRYLILDAPFKMNFYTTPATPVNSCDSPNEGISFVGWECELPLNSTHVITVKLTDEI